MAEMADDVGEAAGRARRWFLDPEIVTAAFLAAATLLTAWTAYQSTRWSGEMAEAYSLASANRSESVRASNEASQLVAIDVASFIAWTEAIAAGEPDEADFLRERFREEFKPAFEAWLSSPAEPGHRAPPGTPFNGLGYTLAAQQESERLATSADEQFEIARSANQYGDNYVLTAVMFASVLFLTGISSRLDLARIQTFLLGLAGVLLAAGIVLVAVQPKSIGI